MKQLFLLQLTIVFNVFLLISCQKDLSKHKSENSSVDEKGKSDGGKTKTFYGPAVQMKRGIGRAWVTLDQNGKPVTLGLSLSAKAALSQGHEDKTYTFQLPKQVPVPPYDHIDLGWNPHGHEPAGTYDLPHFDLHYYMITTAFQATIPFLAPPAADLPLPEKYKPANYLFTPGLVPNMGAHLVDLEAPEFNGGTFSKTFIYGSYRGNLIFLEPMFTQDYLTSLTEGAAAMITPIRQPSAFQRAGYYPKSYTISYDKSPREFIITLNDLTFHTAQ